MITSKLISLLKLLSTKEVKTFLVFCQSDITFVRKGVSDLINLLLPLHPHYVAKDFSEKKIFNKLFRNKKFNKKQLLHVQSNATNALEVFLAILQLSKSKHKTSLFFIDEMLARNELHYTQQFINAFMKKKNDNNILDDSHYEFNFKTTELAYKHAMLSNGYYNGFKQLVNDLEEDYIFKKLKYYCEVLNQQNIFQDEINKDEIIRFKKTAELSNNLKSLGIEIYLRILNLLLHPNDPNNYIQLKNSLYENEPKIASTEKRNLFTYLLNYCIRKLNTGETDFLEELFGVYEFMLDKKIIIENNQLSEFDFKNIVTIALRLKKHDWTEKFMHTYALMIEARNRENAIAYNQSRILYAKQEYKAALRLVHKVNFTDIYYQLDAKILLLKIYYDIHDEDALLSQISALKIFLKRSKEISKYQIQANFNFCNCLIILNKIRNGAVKNMLQLKSKLGVDRKIIDITWIEERLASLTAS